MRKMRDDYVRNIDKKVHREILRCRGKEREWDREIGIDRERKRELHYLYLG